MVPRGHYDAYYSVDEELFDAPARQSLNPLAEPPKDQPPAHASLASPHKPGPGFSVGEAERQAQKYYDTLTHALNRTLPHLARSAYFRDMVRDFREQGWKDWHLLQAIAELVADFRVEKAADPVEAALQQALNGLSSETPSDVLIDPDLVDEESLRIALMMSVQRAAHEWGLRLPPIGCTSWLLQLLTDRYAFLRTDVSHQDPFR